MKNNILVETSVTGWEYGDKELPIKVEALEYGFVIHGNQGTAIQIGDIDTLIKLLKKARELRNE